jgi:hypothetical protein
MSQRLSGLKASLKADREPPAKTATVNDQPVAPRTSTRAKAREGKRAVNIMATERDTTLQAILGEAIDLWLREQGRHPFGER